MSRLRVSGLLLLSLVASGFAGSAFGDITGVQTYNIGEARAFPDGSSLRVTGTVTAAYPLLHEYWMQEPIGPIGIRVVTAAAEDVPAVNTSVVIQGVLGADPNTTERTLSQTAKYSEEAAALIIPTYVQCSAVGGEDLELDNATTSGPNTGEGLLNVGTKVKVSGRVDNFPYMKIDDGSIAGFPFSIYKLHLDASRLFPNPPVIFGGQHITATGISSMVYYQPAHHNVPVVNLISMDESSKLKVAYIYTSIGVTQANQMADLLATIGLSTDLIDLTTLSPSTILADYGMVIIGPDTAAGWSGGRLYPVQRSRHVLGMGEGGYSAFGGLTPNNLGSNAAYHTINEAVAPSASSEVWLAPNNITFSQFDHTMADPPRSMPVIPLGPDVNAIALDSASPTNCTVCQDAQWPRFVLWSFNQPPSSYTDDGKKLFLNLVYWLAMK